MNDISQLGSAETAVVISSIVAFRDKFRGATIRFVGVPKAIIPLATCLLSDYGASIDGELNDREQEKYAFRTHPKWLDLFFGSTPPPPPVCSNISALTHYLNRRPLPLRAEPSPDVKTEILIRLKKGSAQWGETTTVELFQGADTIPIGRVVPDELSKDEKRSVTL